MVTEGVPGASRGPNGGQQIGNNERKTRSIFWMRFRRPKRAQRHTKRVGLAESAGRGEDPWRGIRTDKLLELGPWAREKKKTAPLTNLARRYPR